MPRSKRTEDNVEALRADLNDLADRVKSMGSEAAEEVTEKAEEYVDEAKEMAQNAWKQTRQAGEKTKKYVEDHPWPSLATVLAVGFLAGMVLGRRQGS